MSKLPGHGICFLTKVGSCTKTAPALGTIVVKCGIQLVPRGGFLLALSWNYVVFYKVSMASI